MVGGAGNSFWIAIKLSRVIAVETHFNASLRCHLECNVNRLHDNDETVTGFYSIVVPKFRTIV